MSTIRLEQKGIVSIPADAIVNAANTGLWAGGGVCAIIFQKAGMSELQTACNAIGHCDTGSAVITPGFNCPCKYIIHAVGPRYIDGKHGEPDQLYGAYKKSLELCHENGIHSVVFPLISAGIFGYPVEAAWKQALYACSNFMNKNRDYNIDIIFAIPDSTNLAIGKALLQKKAPPAPSAAPAMPSDTALSADATATAVLEEAKKQIMHIVRMSPLEDEDVDQVEQCFDSLIRKYSKR